MKIITVILLSILTCQSYAQAGDDIQYVTGKLYLSLYQQADSGSKVIKSMVSGDRLDVIEIAGPYAKVITDSGKEGWVKKGFLVKIKPAIILYKETAKALKVLQKKVEIDKDNMGSLIELNQQVEELEQENNDLKKIKVIFLRQKEIEEGLNTTKQTGSTEATNNIDLDVFIIFIKEYTLYLLAVFVLLVLIGFRLGELKTESDVIKHFGGVKVW